MSREQLIAERARLIDAQRLVARQPGAGEAQAGFHEAAQRVRRLHEMLIASRSMDDLLTTESADRPIFLAPLRIETRYERPGGTGEPNALLIRIFPDAFSTEFFDEMVTAEEARLAKAFVEAETADPGGEDALKALEAFIAAVDPERQLYILDGVRAGRFTADDIYPDSEETTLSTLGQYRGLPDRFVACGYRDGAEIFRKEGLLVDAALPTVLDPDPNTAIPEWFVDNDQAIARGMAIRIDGAEFAALAAGERPFEIDRLIVVGVEIAAAPQKDPDAATKPESSLAALLRGHRFGPSGLSFPPPEDPTNATDAVSVDHDVEAPPPERLRALARNEAEDLTLGTDAKNLANALGLDEALFKGLSGASRSSSESRKRVFDALAPGSLGAYRRLLASPLPRADFSDEVETFARLFVHPGGVFPTLRVDDQPYGVLPVMSAVFAQDLMTDETDPEGGRLRGARIVASLMEEFGEEIQRSLAALTTDREQGDSRDQLNAILRWLPRSHLFDRRLLAHEWHYRHALALAGFEGVWTQLSQARQEAGAWRRGFKLGGKTPPLQARLFPMEEASGIEAPLIPDGDLDTTLDALADLGFDDLIARMADRGQSLFERLVLSSAFWSMLEARDWLLATGPVPELDLARLERPLVQDETSPLQFLASDPGTLDLASDLPIPTPGQSVGAYLLSIDDSVLSAKRNPWPRARQALLALRGIPRGEMMRLTSLFIDGLSYRLDAWRTGIALQQLDKLHSEQPDRIALIGAYGVIENLRPAPALRPQPADTFAMDGNRGFIHAHSLDHATTAAVLRSAFEPDANGVVDETLAVDLSSRRVRRGLEIIEGLAAGGTIAGLLGAQFESDIRAADENGDLLQHLPLLRGTFPGLANAIDETAAGEEADKGQGMQIVDGQKLADDLETRDASGLRYQGSLTAIPAGSARTRIDEAAAGVVETLDAFDDLCVAEGVHQILRGQVDRSAAAIEMMSSAGAGAFPTPEIAHPTNAGPGVTLRLILADNALPPAGALSPRAQLAPTVNAWLADRLSPILSEELTLDLEIEGVNQTATLRLSDLSLAPLDLITLGIDRIKPLIARQASGRMDAGFANNQPQPFRMAMGAIRTAGQLLKGASVLKGSDLQPSGQPDPMTEDLAAVRARIDAVLLEFQQAETRLGAASDRDIRSVLDELVIFDPGLAPIDLQAAPPELRQRTLETMQARRTQAAASLVEPNLDAPALRAIAGQLCGEDVIVTVPFTAPLASELATSFAEQTSLLATASARVGDPVADWAEGLIDIRPRFAALAALDAALGGQILSSTANDMVAGQLPYLSGDAWFAHIFPEGSPPKANTVSYGLLGGGITDPVGPIEGLKLDEWIETIATRETPQALSFHFDAPDTESPNTCLLAIPRPNIDTWSVDELLGCVNEAMLIAEWRGLTPDHFAGTELSHWLPATLAPLAVDESLFSIDFAAAPATDEEDS
ncbi:MAG: hypothetical protein AAF251_15305 [Pseudomonadota bacterium]